MLPQSLPDQTVLGLRTWNQYDMCILIARPRSRLDESHSNPTDFTLGFFNSY